MKVDGTLGVIAFVSQQLLLLCYSTTAFNHVPPPSTSALKVAMVTAQPVSPTAETVAGDTPKEHEELERERLKHALLRRLGRSKGGELDPVLADPQTKEPLSWSVKGPIIRGGSERAGVGLILRSSDRVYEGRTNTYLDLLESAATAEEKTQVSSSPVLSSLLTLSPPPLRFIIAKGTNTDYVPMRDLFTSPSVSFAYERGWRQGFAAAGFPGADKEFDMAQQYFAPTITRKRSIKEGSVLVDMSCATGLFTRRFTKSNEYSRVIACDYSDSMLTEARRRIRADPEIAGDTGSSVTKLDLVRCDVGNIPMKTDSVDAFHAGAAMHCWPEIDISLKEIYRVLTNGGRYFATTFLGNYFSTVAGAEKTINGGTDLETSMQAFQYFPNKQHLESLLMDAGFEKEKISVEIIGSACAVMRCEK